MVELRKRKTPTQPAPPPPAKKRSSSSVKSAIDKVKAVVADKKEEPAATSSSGSKGFPTVGSTIALDEFGGEVETHDGQKTSLKKLVEESTGGVVLFTYPKASTPGCK